MTFKDRGIVLKTYPKGESDKSLVLLLKERGRVNVNARGASKPNSKLAASSQPFCYSEFIIFEGKGFLSLTQADIVESFYNIHQDFDKYCYAAFALEYLERLILPETQSSESDAALQLILRTLNYISKGAMPPQLAASVFELKLLQMQGLAPQPNICAICGTQIFESEHNQRGCFFGPDGFVCRRCAGQLPDLLALGNAATRAMFYILESEVPQAFCFRLEGQGVRQISDALSLFRKFNVELNFKSLELIDTLPNQN